MTLKPVSSAVLPRATSDRPDLTAGARPRPFADYSKPSPTADAVRLNPRPLPAQILPAATYSKPSPASIRPLPAVLPGPVAVASEKPVTASKLPDPAFDSYNPVADVASDSYVPVKDSSTFAKPRVSAKA